LLQQSVQAQRDGNGQTKDTMSNQSINQFIYFRPHGSIVNRRQTTGRWQNIQTRRTETQSLECRKICVCCAFIHQPTLP